MTTPTLETQIKDQQALSLQDVLALLDNMQDDDAGYVECLLSCATNPEFGPRVLYEEAVKARCATILHRNEPLYQGALLLRIGKILTYQTTTWDKAIQAIPQQAHKAYARVISMDEVEEQDIDWLWEPYVAVSKLCLLDGDPGVGKSGVAGILATAVSKGYPMPDQTGKPTLSTGAPGISLLVGMEDDLADTLKKRLRLMEADMSKIKVLNDIVTERGRIQPFTLEHLPLLEEEVQRYQPRLVYVDNLQLILGGKVDINRANQVAEVMEGLVALASRYRFALICTRHPSKPGQGMGKLLHRGMGSQSFMGRARLALYVEEHPLDETKSLLIQSKSNAGSFGVTQIFSKAFGKFEWAGITRLNAQIMAGSGRGPNPQALIEACFWLEAQLKDGFPQTADHLLDLAEQENIKGNTLYGAKKAMKVVSVKVNDEWFWKLDTTPLSSLTLTTTLTSTTSQSSLSTPQNDGHGEDSQDSEDIEDIEVVRVVTGDGVNTFANTVSAHSDVTLSPLVAAMDDVPPCADCSGIVRWNDHGVIRCMKCWPPQTIAVRKGA